MSTPDTAAELSPEPIPTEIPDKLYFRIGDVARLAGIKPYVLRFWETEFPGLGPKKSGSGHRLYRRKDVEMVLEIKRLLYEQRFTIEGARKFLESKSKQEAAAQASSKPARRRSKTPPAPVKQNVQTELFAGAGSGAALDAVRKELLAILDLLK